jgi:hypothetical protein
VALLAAFQDTDVMMNEGTDNGFVHTRSPSALCCCFFERLKAVVAPFHKERRSEHMSMVTVGMTKAKAEKKKKTKRKGCP